MPRPHRDLFPVSFLTLFFELLAFAAAIAVHFVVGLEQAGR
jgi:hypothetical protein